MHAQAHTFIKRLGVILIAGEKKEEGRKKKNCPEISFTQSHHSIDADG